MKILLATQVVDFPNATWQQQQIDEISTHKKITTPLLKGQRQYFWWKALVELGHEVEVFRYNESTPYTKTISQLVWAENNLKVMGTTRIRSAMNNREWRWIIQQFINKASTFGADIILISEPIKGFNKEDLDELRKTTNAKIAFLIDTSPVVTVPPSFLQLAPHFDIIICNDYYHTFQWQELDAKRAVALPISACDPEHDHPYTLKENEIVRYKCDVCFVGGMAPIHQYSHRLDFLEYLTEFDLGIWTPDVDAILARPALRRFYRGNAHSTEMVKAVSAAKIAINIHPVFMQFGGNQRTFEIPSIGTFQLIDRYDPSWFVDGKEVVRVTTPEDLKEKVRYYLEHDNERKIIAQAGHQRAVSEHTYVHRMKRMLDIINSIA